MPKYSKACNNRHFHEKWGCTEDNLKVIYLWRNGLYDLANTFENFLKLEHGIKSPSVTSICTDCLKKCLQKRVFTKYLTTSSARAIENKVRNITIFLLGTRSFTRFC